MPSDPYDALPPGGDQLVTLAAVEVTPDWLDEMAREVRYNLGGAAYQIYMAGLTLREVHHQIGDSEFKDWADRSFPFTWKTAYQYMRISAFLDERVPTESVHELVASTSVLDTLTRKDLPEEVREDMTDKLLEGQRLTVAMITGAAKAAEESEKRAEILQEADSRVVELSERIEMAPDVIDALDALRFHDVETFEEIEASGCVYDTQGEAIPLDEANGRDVSSYIDHTRFERKMSGLARSGAASIVLNNHRPFANKVVYIKKALIQKQHFHDASVAVVKAVNEQIGELVGPYEEQVDLVFSAYFPRRPIRASEIFIRGYEEGLYHAGILRGDGPDFVSSVKVRSKWARNSSEPRLEIDIYPRAQRE